jgi:hypothetical protein
MLKCAKIEHTKDPFVIIRSFRGSGTWVIPAWRRQGYCVVVSEFVVSRDCQDTVRADEEETGEGTRSCKHLCRHVPPTGSLPDLSPACVWLHDPSGSPVYDALE